MQYDAASVGRIPDREMGLVKSVGDEGGEAQVLFYKGNIPRDEINRIKVVETSIALVQSNEDSIANHTANPANHSGDAVEWRQIPGGARYRINGIDVVILVAILIL
ncbi:hypothetical protein GCM10017653_08050 [Ancylobacter defluvii]|uniref:Uncharacterized protein n=1 Tax=Ancylobacter defluvii TaxID=1282440 RepID=A0A9W6N9T4_9HYPH|nr:hypothetical protein GCM10017653_08050 [Ancylobacter defluvii]